MDVRPLPATSHANPSRGATSSALVGMSERLGPSAPPASPSAGHGFVPGGNSRPLQGLLPKARTAVEGSKLAISSLASYGIVKWLIRSPASTVTRAFTL